MFVQCNVRRSNLKGLDGNLLIGKKSQRLTNVANQITFQVGNLHSICHRGPCQIGDAIGTSQVSGTVQYQQYSNFS